METQTSAKPNSYDVAVRISKHFEEDPEKQTITLTMVKLREMAQRRINRVFITELDYNLGFFGLIMAWGTEVYIINRESDFAPYTGEIPLAGEGADYDASLE